MTPKYKTRIARIVHLDPKPYKKLIKKIGTQKFSEWAREQIEKEIKK